MATRPCVVAPSSSGSGLDDLVIVICEEGYSSSLAAARLQDLGFDRATDVIRGFEGWEAAGLPVVNRSQERSDLNGA